MLRVNAREFCRFFVHLISPSLIYANIQPAIFLLAVCVWHTAYLFQVDFFLQWFWLEFKFLCLFINKFPLCECVGLKWAQLHLNSTSCKLNYAQGCTPVIYNLFCVWMPVLRSLLDIVSFANKLISVYVIPSMVDYNVAMYTRVFRCDTAMLRVMVIVVHIHLYFG